MSFSQKDISIIFIIFSRYLKSILKKMNYINVENLTKTYGIITLFLLILTKEIKLLSLLKMVAENLLC